MSPSHFGDRLATAVAQRESQIVCGLTRSRRLWPGDDLAAALPRRHRGRGPAARRRQAAARLLRALRPRRLGRARRDRRARARPRAARDPRRQARRRPRHRHRLRARRSPPATPSPSTRCSAATPAALVDGPRRPLPARPHLEPRRRRRARPRARRRAVACGSTSPASPTSSAPPADHGLKDVGAVTGATEPQHLARMRELMPHTPFLLPGVGAQGGDVDALGPAFAPGRAGGLVTASRSIVDAYERADAARRRGGAPARAGVGPIIAGVTGRVPHACWRPRRWWRPPSRSSPSSPPAAEKDAPSRPHARRRRPRRPPRHDASPKREKRLRRHLHGRARRHAVGDRRRRRTSTSQDAARGQPRHRPGRADRRRGAEAAVIASISRVPRRAVFVSARLTALLALRSPRPPRPPARTIDSPDGIVVEAGDGRRHLREGRRRAPPDGLDDEADDGAADASSRATSTSRHGAALPRRARRSVVGLVTGEEITVADLLRALLVVSANDAAVALALHVGGRCRPSCAR